MMDEGRIRGDEKPRGTGGAGVRAPSPGESSSDQIPRPSIPGADGSKYEVPNLDTPTELNLPAIHPSSEDGGHELHLHPRPVRVSIYEEETGLAAGTVLGSRYEILEMLGIGGMGAVYKARDIELNRMVALKVIRPEFARDPGIISRFKQELILATQVTHKNVIRIYDLGEANGLRFITMEYIQGSDLRAMLRERGKLAPDDAVAMVRQVCRALRAAHAVGVIHRDLKPQNIMCEPSGRVLVMDFGLARTLEDNGMTQSGSMVGTMEYMSPEQALAGYIDQRSDLFALGIIFYELLSGATPFQAGSAVASLILRTQQRVVSLCDLDPTIPKALSDIVCKCLERDLSKRYQGAGDVLGDLDAYEGKTTLGDRSLAAQAGPESIVAASPAPPQHEALLTQATEEFIARKPWRRWRILAPVALVLLVATGFYLYRASSKKHTAGSVLSLAVLPLRNATGDANLDALSSSLADMLISSVGQSEHLHTIPPERMRQVYSDLRLAPSSTIDPAMLHRIAGFTSAETVVYGQYSRLGDQIHIDVSVQDLKTDHVVELQAQSAEKDLPSAIAGLANSVRKNLALTAADIKEVRAQSYVPQSNSVEALQEYNAALSLMSVGRNLEARKQLQSAVGTDPKFALAFARLAEAESDLGYQMDAEQSSRRAVELAESEKLPPAAKYLIEASHARVMQESSKAIESYQNLARNLSGDTDVQYALGDLYVQTGEYDKGRAQFDKILKEDPKDLRALWQMGVIEITSNNPQAALDPLNKGLSLAIQTDNQEMKGLLLLSVGIAYRLLNKPQDALDNYQQSIAISEKLGQKRAVAAALDEMAQVQSSTGKSDAALLSYQRSLQLLREIGMKKELGDTLLDMGVVLSDRGQSDLALQAYQDALQVQRETGDQNLEATCLSNIATLYVNRGDTGNAFTYFQQALQLREKLGVPGFIAETLSGMGEAYSVTGRYEDALKSFLRALDLWRKAGDQHGAAIVSDQMGTVFLRQGRFGAAVHSMHDAVNGLQALGQHSKDLAEAQKDLAESLADAGRGGEAHAALESADQIARDLNNDDLMAAIANTRGDVEFYSGDLKGAGQHFQKAVQLGRHSNNASVAAESQLNLARVAIAQGRAREAVAALSAIVASRTAIDKNLALRSSLTLSEALVETKALPRARLALLSDLGVAERAGMKLELAKADYLLGRIARLSGNSDDAANYYSQALRGLVALRNEDGGEKLLDRMDLKAISEECIRGTAK